MFWIYAASAARMAALQGLRFIGIGTHDSIGIGEDGMSYYRSTELKQSVTRTTHRSHSSAYRASSVLPGLAKFQSHPAGGRGGGHGRLASSATC
jgi:hypothetical protein